MSVTWTSLDTWIVVTGILAATSSALLGAFLLLRRMSLMGDAISHAVLPGLAVAFLISGSRGSFAMFAGAVVVGILTALLTQWIHALGKVEESAAMGVVFTTLFAFGLVLIVRAADAVDLDPGCVLYGGIELTPLDTRPFFGFEVPHATLILGGTLLVNVLFVASFYKELRITSFDPSLATTLGIRASWMHYALMVLVAVTTIAAFESVGSILVVAMLIVPPATAHLLTDRYGLLLLLSLILAASAAVLGHLGAISIPTWFGYADTSTAGMIGVASGFLFTVALLFAPRHGIVSRAAQQALLALRIAREDILGLLFRLEEREQSTQSVPVLTIVRRTIGGTRLVAQAAMFALRRGGRVRYRDGAFELTDTGRAEARTLVRSHRLWETYVAKHFDIPSDHLHSSAERAEHFVTSKMSADLTDELQNAVRDPQGRIIPTAPSDRPSNEPRSS